jgi:hypothetical protein
MSDAAQPERLHFSIRFEYADCRRVRLLHRER